MHLRAHRRDPDPRPAVSFRTDDGDRFAGADVAPAPTAVQRLLVCSDDRRQYHGRDNLGAAALASGGRFVALDGWELRAVSP